MRKWIVLLLVFILALVGFVYFSTPKNVSLFAQTRLAVNRKAFARVLLETDKWQQWWPTEGKVISPLHFQYNGADYRILEKRFSSLLFSIRKDNDSVLAELQSYPLAADSVGLNWTGSPDTVSSFFTKVAASRRAKNLSADMHLLLQKAKAFYTSEDNLYGLAIKNDLVVDSLLVSTVMESKEPPSTAAVYGLIDKLLAYVQKADAKQTGQPMLNVTHRSDSTYLTRVALPVDRRLPGNGEIQFRWMLGLGDILTANVRGGPWAIKNAFVQMEQYAQDHNRTAPAIPFESLVTDRRKESDTTKWVTKVYWPVM